MPIVGNVAAGSPILAQECIEDYLTFHTGHPGDVHFALRVRGESMLNAGILPGDLVVVRQQQTCNQGEIVVAMIDDEATVKRFSRKTATSGYCRKMTITNLSTAPTLRSWAKW